MFSPSRAHPSAAPALDPPPTHADPLVALWFEAVATYESETHLKLSRPTASIPSTLDSADAIFNFVNYHETTFKAFRNDGAIHLSGRLRHITAVVGTLSSSIGEGVGVVSHLDPRESGPSLTTYAAALRAWKGDFRRHRGVGQGTHTS